MFSKIEISTVWKKLTLFLAYSNGRSAVVTDSFPDVEKLIQSVKKIQKVVGLDLLDLKKAIQFKDKYY